MTMIRWFSAIGLAAATYAIGLAVALSAYCFDLTYSPAQRCGFAVPALHGAAVLGVMFLVAGLMATSIVMSPMIALLHRYKIHTWWSASIGAMFAGLMPLVIPCLGAKGGCAPSDWWPFPALAYGFAGICGLIGYEWMRSRHRSTARTAISATSARTG
jgi:hypothetical protein